MVELERIEKHMAEIIKLLPQKNPMPIDKNYIVEEVTFVKLSEFHNGGNLYLRMSFIDNTSACIDYSSTADSKEHSIHWTICRSTLL